MSITHWPLKERPREKLLDLGPDALSEAELLAIFLRTGVKGKTAVDLARDLLNHFGGLRNLMEAPLINFCETRGLGPAKYAQLKAVLEMGRRHLYAKLQEPDHVKNSDQTKEYIVSQLRSYKREVFACLFLDSRHRMLGFDELFFGTLDCANVHPREVVKSALEHNAAAVIFAHNHPSGISEPSREDISITKQLIKTLEFIEVRVLDHIVVGNGEVTSFAERGLL